MSTDNNEATAWNGVMAGGMPAQSENKCAGNEAASGVLGAIAGAVGAGIGILAAQTIGEHRKK